MGLCSLATVRKMACGSEINMLMFWSPLCMKPEMVESHAAKKEGEQEVCKGSFYIFSKSAIIGKTLEEEKVKTQYETELKEERRTAEVSL